MKLLLLALALAPAALGAQTGGSSPGQVPPVDLARLKVSDFADSELDLPYYLANFSRVANSVPVEGELRGWITTSVWRGNSNQHTYNARVLESQLSLAYFYCARRPWNPYYGAPAVRARLEAMLERWCNLQGTNGEFSEYGEGRWSLAPTAFATKFMGESLRLLTAGPAFDPELLARVKQAQRKAILATLTDPELWRHGEDYANQFSNIFAGGLAWLALHPDDEEIRAGLLKRMKDALTGLQSPAGYFYERGGCDWGYSLSTHHSNLEIAWHYGRGTAFEPLLLEMVQHYYEWLSWNAVLEPDGSGFVLNRAIETRQRKPWLGLSEDAERRNFVSVPQAERVMLARAFLPTRTQAASWLAARRAGLEKVWPDAPELRQGDFRGFTPYAFLHRNIAEWLPDSAQQAEARARLPYLHNGRYAHLRADSRHQAEFLFVRRPNYYAVFNAGEKLAEQQRFGLGLLWTPKLGALAQSQSASDEAAWGTIASGQAAPCEAGELKAVIEIAGKQVKPESGGKDLGDGEVTVSYPLGKSGAKTLRFEDGRIQIMAEHSGEFLETIPLLLRADDQIRTEPTRVILERNGKPALSLGFAPSTTAEVAKPGGGSIGPYRVAVVRLKAKDKLSYEVAVPAN